MLTPQDSIDTLNFQNSLNYTERQDALHFLLTTEASSAAVADFVTLCRHSNAVTDTFNLPSSEAI